MKMVLMHPPLDDPTLPYHSTAYLKGHLVANGFCDVHMRDINIEFVNHLFEANTITRLNEIADERRRSLERKVHLSFEEQEEYHAIACADRFDHAVVSEAVRGFRDRETFLDFTTYSKHLNVLVGHLGLAGALSYPCECTGFLHRTRGRVSLYNLGDLFNIDLMRRACFPFVNYFEERLQFDPQLAEADLLGISIVYDHQLIHALHFARMLKVRWPEKSVVLGGTSISQLYKHLKNKALMRRFFELCDAIVVGEGETAICEIAASGKITPGSRFTNTITYDHSTDELFLPAIHYENLPTLGSPIYDHEWDLYLSPERGINYAPTRGCYWNRCTFCDYGLNTDAQPLLGARDTLSR